MVIETRSPFKKDGPFPNHPNKKDGEISSAGVSKFPVFSSNKEEKRGKNQYFLTPKKKKKP